MDQDTDSIAGIKSPPKATKSLFHLSILLDVLGLSLSLFVGISFTLVNVVLVILSRLYSWREVRIKRFAIWGFVIVAFAQGGISYVNMLSGLSDLSIIHFAGSPGILLQGLAATLLVGAIYPITQIYQHEQDRKAGDRTISMLIGIRGSFILSGALFLCVDIILFNILPNKHFYIFILGQLPLIILFLIWMIESWKDATNVSFEKTMRFIILASILLNITFSILLYLKFMGLYMD